LKTLGITPMTTDGTSFSESSGRESTVAAYRFFQSRCRVTTGRAGSFRRFAADERMLAISLKLLADMNAPLKRLGQLV